MDSQTNTYLYSTIIAVCYIIFSILEMRFVNDETRPLKEVFKSTLLVFFSALCSFYVLSTTSTTSGGGVTVKAAPTEIFTGNPEF